jgi:DNA-binding Lrp family transcriptional regulator
MTELAQEKNYNIITIALAILIFLVSMLPFVVHYKANDNHQNWLNHDYGKNLMSSAELGSIFMTEGGDNQVFGTLYFTHSEKLRPDLTLYDQKGNIFKRIYGDMRYIDRGTLERRQQLVDRAIFSGEEPFYVDIRDRADPYFIPYWQGTRPVYLTWERPRPWTLGDYYYRRYGIMYKLQDIEYRLVDYLELKQEISINEARGLFAQWLHRDISPEYTLNKIAKLQNEGLIRRVGNSVRFVKMYPMPYDGDYFEKYLLRWREVPNAKYWEFLSREIIVNYDYQIGEIYRQRVYDLQEMRARETRPEIIREISNRIEKKWALALEHYNDAVTYGHDSLSILHNVSVVFLNNNMTNLDNEAHELLTRALELYGNSADAFGTYQVMFSFLARDMLRNPENEEKNLAEVDMWFAKLTAQLARYRESLGDHTRHPHWRQAFGIIRNYFDQFNEVDTAQFLALKADFERRFRENPATIDYILARNVIEVMYSRALIFQYEPYIRSADRYLETLVRIKSNDIQFNMWAFQISTQIPGKMQLAYLAGNNVIRASDINDFSFYYSFGKVCYQIGRRGEAKIYLNRFLELIRQDRSAALQWRNRIEEARQILTEIG